MAIKIIARGILPKTIPLRGTCSQCSTVVECTESDVTVQDGDQRDQRDRGYSYVSCPVCSAHIVVARYIEHDGRGPG